MSRELAARALLAVDARDHHRRVVPSNSSGVTTTGPSDGREVLALRRAEPDPHLRRWRSRADQSFITVKPPIAPSAPMIAATSSS